MKYVTIQSYEKREDSEMKGHNISDYLISEVTLTDEYFVNASEKMYAYLEKFDIDRIMVNFRNTAGIKTDAKAYGGWENTLISGHAIGHYMTAIAQAGARGNKKLLAMSDRLIAEMRRAQIKEDGITEAVSKNGGVKQFTVKRGFLFASENGTDGEPVYGEQQFDNIEAGKADMHTQAWVPWYTMHKILSGLVNTYKLTGNTEALETADELGMWVYNRVKNYADIVTDTGETMQERVLSVEYGGMNDALYELYKLTRNIKHAEAAHMFDEIPLFEELYKDNDILADKHANTTIPKIMGALNRYLSGADRENGEFYLTASKNFWQMVKEHHEYATGGNSVNEHFRQACTQNCHRENTNCETCNTYNMLKLSRELFKITGDRKYADYYESTLLNAIVSSQNPETGMTMYFQPMATGYFKVFSREWEDFWCCTGSGMESMTKLNDSIYFKLNGGTVINQYISSVLTDRDNNIQLTQILELFERGYSKITAEPVCGEKQSADIVLRMPEWLASDPTVRVNGEEYHIDKEYTTISREWHKGDTIEITLPMKLRAYGLPDSDTAVCFKYGPVLLSAGLGREDMDKEEITGENVRIPSLMTSLNEDIKVSPEYGTREKWLDSLDENMVKSEDKLEFTMKNTDCALVFTPHYKRYNERYGIYWYLS